MNKGILTGLIIIILALIGGGIYFVHFQNTKKIDTTTTNQSTTQSTDNANMSHGDDTSTAPSTQTSAVSIIASNFEPQNITVKKGTTVTWTNNDSIGHSVISQTDGGPHSEVLSRKQTYSFTFNTAGTFNYICGVHPSMKGSVTVTE